MPAMISPVIRALTLVAVLFPPDLHAAHPLITEDTGTQGTGNFQVELTTEHITSRESGFDQYLVLTSTVLAYGVAENADIILVLPYLRLGASALDSAPGASGLADTGLDVKWRFYEQGRYSLALKPGVTLPTGDTDNNLGTGRNTWSLYVVGTYNPAPWAFHLHLGHLHHNNTFNERVDIWHASAAIVRQVGESLRLILDTGIDTNTDRTVRSNPTFLVTGLIYSPRANLDLDLGYKFVSDDRLRGQSLLAGLTLRW